ncbi:MAG TPA: hypothetical protein VE912_14345 [Bacteroidales bacterium]|nr:hypothetical protein [Bacteroidales bacterium]
MGAKPDKKAAIKGRPANAAKNHRKQKNKNRTEKLTFPESLNAFFERHQMKFFWVFMMLATIFSLLLFDKRVSPGGDDSMYIIRAYDFIHKFVYPSYQGPLYPIVLSPFVLIFGVNIIPLKALSLVFIIGSLFFFFRAYRNRIPASLLIPVFILISINAHILYYGSQTYNEAFFMFLQSLFFIVVFKKLIDNDPENLPLKSTYKGFLLTGLMIVLLGYTRSIGYASLFAVMGYFILKKKWKSLLYIFGSFILFFALFHFIKLALWDHAALDFKGQAAGLMRKKFYSPAAGNEDFAGYLKRFVGNSNMYISRHFYVLLGLRPDRLVTMKPVLTIFTYLLFILGLFKVARKNNYLFFTGIYAGLFCFLTFFILQEIWGQSRLIIPYFPLILLFLLATVYYFVQQKKLKSLSFLIILIPLILLFSDFIRLHEKVKEQQKIHSIYDGLTPDWVNFIKMSEWADKNVKADDVIASRKPSISFVYGNGHDFFGIMRLPSERPDSLVNKLIRKGEKPVIVPYKELYEKKFPEQLYGFYRKDIQAVINDIGVLYGIYSFEPSKRKTMLNELGKYGIHYYADPDSALRFAGTFNIQAYAARPDSLLHILMKNDVSYVIMASLRVIPAQKTGRTINTVQRFLFFTEQKYPGLFEEVKMIGGKNDEPAYLFRVNYKKYNLNVK